MTYFSHSKLDSFIQCPKKFYFRYVQKIKSNENGVEAYMGTQVHTVLETYFKDSLAGKVLPKEYYIQMFIDLYWNKLGPHIFIVMDQNNYQFYAERGLNCLYDFFRYNLAPKPEEKDLISLEYNVKIPICGGKHTLTGFIDYLKIEKTADGSGLKATILDYKSGKKIPSRREVAENVQLSIYDKAVRHIFKDVKETVLQLYFLVENKIFTTFRTDEDREQTEVYINKTVDEIEKAEKENNFPANKGFLCGWCEYQAVCPQFKHLYEDIEV